MRVLHPRVELATLIRKRLTLTGAALGINIVVAIDNSPRRHGLGIAPFMLPQEASRSINVLDTSKAFAFVIIEGLRESSPFLVETLRDS